MSGRVIWITGLSGAGKTTLAMALQKILPCSVLLDGDKLREALGSQSFDTESRKNLALTYSRLARMIAEQGLTVIVATISLFHEVHNWNRQNLKNYMEIFLDVPEAVRQARDPKGLYAAHKRGEIMQMAGTPELIVEIPLNPDLRLDETNSIEEACGLILKKLEITES